mgnify:CR=1 FL=1
MRHSEFGIRNSRTGGVLAFGTLLSLAIASSALAAPVEAGMMFAAAARARRGSLCGPSTKFWSFV